MQVKLQAPLMQAGAELAGPAGQGAHSVPHEPALVFARHWSAHRWKPESHTNPQLVPSQVALAFAGGVQGVQRSPQAAVDWLDGHWSPQR